MIKFSAPSLLAFCLAALFTGCREQPAAPAGSTQKAVDTTAMVVAQVAGCARLYTAECVVRKVVTHSDAPRVKGRILGFDIDEPARIGDRKVAIPIEVTLKAYIDFEHFSASQVVRTDSSITIILPDPVIISTSSKIDHDGTQQFIDPLRSRFTDAEMADFARQGAESVMSHLSQFGLAEQARRSAANTLTPLLRRMGYGEGRVTVEFRKNFNDKELRGFVVTNERQQ